MAPTEPDLPERRTIDEMLYAKLPTGKIAQEIGGHRRAIYPEIRDCPEFCALAWQVRDEETRV